MRTRREVEICVETLQNCETAALGGADRIELCAALDVGGVTPGSGLLRAVVEGCSVPVHVLIRPRAGNFVYSSAEFRAICVDAEEALSLGAAGVVVGVLTADRRVDAPRTRELLGLAAGRPVTFHRAFDRTADVFASLDTLLDLGCDRILTSGGRPTVSAGYTVLAALADRAQGRIRLAAGGGVTLANAAQLLGIAGLDLHASLRPKRAEAVGIDPLWQEDDDAQAIALADVRTLCKMARAAEAHHSDTTG